jgi:hypothetical protein
VQVLQELSRIPGETKIENGNQTIPKKGGVYQNCLPAFLAVLAPLLLVWCDVVSQFIQTLPSPTQQ